MATPSRSSKLTKTHKVLKKYYKPAPVPAERQVLEQLLFACCLEDAPTAAAEKTFASLSETFFDWNEVRVSSLRELAEVLSPLPDPNAAAMRLKRTLQSVFEMTYSFEIEDLKKENLGKATTRLKRINGTTPFSIGFVIQHSLGGHCIPVSAGAMQALTILGIVSEAEAKVGAVPGMERAISKTKGHEFGSLLQQLGADFAANPYSPAVHKILLEIDPSVKDRLPKRLTRKQAAALQAQQEAEAAAAAERQAKKEQRKKDKAAANRRNEKAAAGNSQPKSAARKKAQPPAAAQKKKVVTASKRSHATGLKRRKPR